MRERVKRIVAQILTFVMLMSVMPVEALAAGLNNSYSSDMVSAVSNDSTILKLQVYGDNATMLVGDTGILASDLDQNYDNVFYDSPNIVTVTLSGTDSKTARITAYNPGTVTVTLSGSGVDDLEYTVTVKEQLDPFTVTITGPNSIVAYKSAQLSVEYTPETVKPSSIVWESSNEEILTVDQKGLVTTHSPGVATVTVHVTDAEGNRVSSEAYEITVTKATEGKTSASFYYMSVTGVSPDTNSTGNMWKSLGNGTINLDGAEFSDGTIGGRDNTYDDVANRVITWPGNRTGSTYTLPRNENAGSDWMALFNAFKSKTEGVDSPEDVEAIILRPYKISRNGFWPFYSYHVDCVVEIIAKDVYTATYYLWDAGSAGYLWQAEGSYHTGDKTQPAAFTESQIANLPATKTTADGVNYTFDGWYTNAARTGDKVDFPYEIKNSNVRFYAKYIAGYQVIYDLDGGAWQNPATPSVYPKNEGTTVYVVSEEPTKSGYAFTGWVPVETDVDISSGSFTMPRHNVTLKAQWEKNSAMRVKLADDTVTYNGQQHSLTNVEVSIDGGTATVMSVADFKSTYGVDLTVQGGTGTDVRNGGYEGTVSGYAEITTNAQVYDVTYEGGTLTINPRNVTLTSATDSKAYDGTPLTNGTVTVGGDGFATGEGATYNVTGTQTNAGSSNNAFTYTLNASTKAENYNITKVEGTLTVSPLAVTVTITGNTDSKVYNGSEQKVEGYEVEISNDLYKESDFTFSGEAVAKGTNVSTYPMGLAESQFTNDNDNFTVTFNVTDGGLEITPKAVTIIAKDASKKYDGTALTEEGFTASALESSDAHTFTVVMTAESTITYVGTQPNVIASVDGIALKTGVETAVGNYLVTTVEGTLAVTDGTDIDPVEPNLVVVKENDNAEYGLNDKVTFNIWAKNIYNEPKDVTVNELEGVTIVSYQIDNGTVVEVNSSTLTVTGVQAGAEITLTATYVVTEADILANGFTNTVSVAFSGGKTFEDDNSVDTEEPNPSLKTVKKTTSTPLNGFTYALGETITYEITVTNDGNLTITDITVMDTVEGYESVVVGTIESLAPGESSEVFKFEHVVTEQDILTGTETEPGYVKNVAVADGKNPSEKPTKTESGTTEDKVDPENPEIVLSKVINNSTGKPYGFNKEIEYLVTIENTGNVSVTDIVIEDVLTSGANPNGLSESLVLEELLEVKDKITLKPGDMITATYTYTTQDGDFRPPYQADGVTVNEHWVKNEAKAVGVASNDAAVESNPDNAETQVEQWYQAIFIDSRTNEVIDIVRVPYGGNITAPDVPEHRGYDFIRWTDWFWENVTFNQTIYALYERDTETIYDAKIPLAGGYISNVGDCFD